MTTTMAVTRNVKPLKKSQDEQAQNIENITDDLPHVKISAEIMHKVEKAATSGEITPSVRKMITNKNNDKYFEVKKVSNMSNTLKAHEVKVLLEKSDIIAFLTNTDVKAQVIKRVKSALQRGELTPSVTRMLLDKDNAKIIYSDFVADELDSAKLGRTRVKRSKSLKTTLASKGSLSKLTKNVYKEARECNGQQMQQASGDGPNNNLQNEIPTYSKSKLMVQSRKGFKTLQNSCTFKNETPDKRLSQSQLTTSELRLIACLCGNNESKEETNKMIEAINLAKKIKSIQKEKKQIKKDKKKQKSLRIIRDLKTIARDKKQEKEVDGNENGNLQGKLKNKLEQMERVKISSRGKLLVESIIRIGKLGSSVTCKFLKYTSRAIRRPKVEEETKVKRENPCCSRLEGTEPVTQIEHDIPKSEAVTSLVKKLEPNPITNYLLRRHDTNLGQRTKYLRRSRRPLSFGCNLSVWSRTERPCTCVSYLCPWSYPQFVNALCLWKQFFQILFFLLAFAIWSPCLICM